jgi:serine/threonine-protein kinase
MAAKAPDFKPGEMLPGTKYRIVRQIGAGGMGVVYQVVKPPEIQGVLKLMSSELTEHEEFRTRFLDEVRVLAQIDHPNIVKVFDYDKLPDGTPFYVMELLHGRTVRDVLATIGTFPPRVAFEVTRQLCEALHCAHTHDIPVIHRDIKPENIFLHAPRHGEPQVKLIDFGVVAVADRQHDGTFVGTWKYAAPEQIRGERATPATDLYAVGLVLYEMLCGIGPFEHLDSGSLVSQAHLRDIPSPVSKFAPWVPPSVVELISSALAKEPRQRPRDAYAFAERLYELEWANDGKDPNDRTTEGPLSRILSTAGGAKLASKNLEAAPPKDRLGRVPVIGIPGKARHGGPTIKGVGTQQGHDHTSPGEDTLLAGLDGRPDVVPRSKKARESDPSNAAPRSNEARGSGPSGAAGERAPVRATPRPPNGAPLAAAAAGEMANGEVATMAAPPSDSAMEAAKEPAAAAASPAAAATNVDSESDAATLKRMGACAEPRNDSDTLGAQESDAQRAPRKTGKLAVPIAVALFALIAVVSFAAYRVRSPAVQAGAMPIGDGHPQVAAAAPIGEATTTEAPAPAAALPVAREASPVAAVASVAASSTSSTPALRGGKPAAPPARMVTTAVPGSAPAGAPPEAPKKPSPSPSSRDESFLRGL